MIIGLVGFAGSGKGTVADILCDEFNFSKIAFADPLKDAVSAIFDWPRNLVEGDTIPSRVFREKPDSFWSEKFERDFTPREALQKLGTEACRNVFDQDIWIYALEKRIDRERNTVVTDVRFPNEIECINRLDGHVVRVKRGKEPIWYETAYNHLHNEEYQMYKKYPDVHISEWAWIGHPLIQHIIDNNGSMYELKNNTIKLLHSLTKSAII